MNELIIYLLGCLAAFGVTLFIEEFTFKRLSVAEFAAVLVVIAFSWAGFIFTLVLGWKTKDKNGY